MDFEIVFLLAIYLLPLAFVSLVGAWAANRKPWLAATLALWSAGMLVYVHVTRDDGLFAWRDIPELTVTMIARVVALF